MKTVICFGDSNTYGYDPRSYLGGRYGPDSRWVDLLAARTGWDVRNQGQNGRTIPGGPVPFPADTDLLTVMQAVENETLGELTVEWRHASAACVILASGGYPGHYEKGKAISLPASLPGNVTIYHAGDRLDESGRLVTSGGRVLGITATGPTLRQALADAYAAAETVDFDGKYLRHDIGRRALAALAD